MAKKATLYKDFNHEQLDRTLQNRLRIAVCAALWHSDEVDFTSLRNAVKTRDGNLSLQLKVLEEAGYISMSKTFVNKRPQTNVALTNQGKLALIAYKKQLEDWIGTTD
jgi:DNA-binding MarR family transcriptional regulator